MSFERFNFNFSKLEEPAKKPMGEEEATKSIEGAMPKEEEAGTPIERPMVEKSPEEVTPAEGLVAGNKDTEKQLIRLKEGIKEIDINQELKRVEKRLEEMRNGLEKETNELPKETSGILERLKNSWEKSNTSDKLKIVIKAALIGVAGAATITTIIIGGLSLSMIAEILAKTGGIVLSKKLFSDVLGENKKVIENMEE